jgi:hypothetical protein
MGTNTATGVTKMERDDVDMAKPLALSPPHPPAKEEKEGVKVMPMTVRIVWQDNDATDSSSDEENVQRYDGKTNSGLRRIKQCGCEIKLKRQRVTMPGKVDSEEIVIAKRTRLNG